MKTQRTVSPEQVRQKSSAPVAGKTAKSARPDRAVSEVSTNGSTRIDPAERQRLVAERAYFRAEKRGFAPGGELQDWFEAEAEIEQVLRQ